MATTLAQPYAATTLEQNARPQSQPLSKAREQRRADKNSANRVKARPAHPLVISSILDSFGVLQSPSGPSGDEEHTERAKWRRRTYTADDSVTDLPSPAASGSPGFGMEYPVGLMMDDESGTSNAAPPPIIRTTSRNGWETPSHKPVRPTSFMSMKGHSRTRSSSTNSRLSTAKPEKDKEKAGKNRLSSESWVKRSSVVAGSPRKDWSKDEKQSLRRKSSEESLRNARSRAETVTTPSIASSMSRAEQIIALASAPRSAGAKRRLYLTDTGSQEEHSLILSNVPAEETRKREISGQVPAKQVNGDGDVDSVVQQILADHVKSEEGDQVDASLRRSPQRSSIVDSIPTRTSSLRRTSASPAPGKRKERKSKRKSESGRMAKTKLGSERGSFVSSASSKEILDSSWNDLDEEDETVKRILELREQRKARMLEPPRSPSRGLSPAKSDVSNRSTSAKRSLRSQSSKGSLRLRPEASRSITEPSPLSQEEMRNENELAVPNTDSRPLDRRKANGQSPEPKPEHRVSIDEPRSPLRPLSARSNASSNPPLSLDYSYSAAVDALHGGQSPSRVISPLRNSTSPATPEPSIRNIGAVQNSAQSIRSIPTSTRSKSFRWRITSQHPDLPLDYDKKSRHKSISMANTGTMTEPRRNSLDLAVSEYLRADRLSQRIKHPLSGRMISFSEVGDPEGAAVIICLGMGLTRYVSAFFDELASTLRLRLITIDRPGVGNSEPYPPNNKSGPLSWPDDVLAVCQHLGVSKFSMLAHSAGAIYALATALILPHLIRGKVHLLSPWIPPSQLEALSNPTASTSVGGVLPRSQRFLRILPTPLFKAANASFMTATSASLNPNAKGRNKTELRRSGPTTPSPESRPVSRNNRRESMMLMDQFMPGMNPTDNFPVKEIESSPNRSNSAYRMSPTATPMDPSFEFASTGLNAAEHVAKERKQEYTTLLTQRTWELATRDSNPATDLLICLERHRDIGFRYTDVHQEVVITHGSEDKRVPVANVRWLAEQMNRHSLAFGAAGTKGKDGLVGGGCEIRVLEGEGHGLMASPAIMGDILTEIAGY